jgi:hypothetical protein
LACFCDAAVEGNKFQTGQNGAFSFSLPLFSLCFAVGKRYCWLTYSLSPSFIFVLQQEQKGGRVRKVWQIEAQNVWMDFSMGLDLE